MMWMGSLMPFEMTQAGVLRKAPGACRRRRAMLAEPRSAGGRRVISVRSDRAATARRAVVFAVDDGYLPFALFAAERIAALHPDRDFDICLCSDGPLAPPPRFAALGLRVLEVSAPGAFSGLRLDPGKTEVVYLRLALPEALAADYDRLLYLDADIFVQGGDFAGLLGVDLGGKAVGAVRDNTQWRTPSRRPEQFRRLGLASAPYFNAGVLLIDVARWRESGVMERCVAFGRANKAQMIRHDQNLLNGVLQGDFAELSPVWNWQYTWASSLTEAMVVPNIVHFIGRKKPWKQGGDQLSPRYRRAFRDFLKATFPERAVPDDGPATGARAGYVRKLLLKHFIAAGSMARYLARFPDELTVRDPRA
jgi:hypothetical protein